MRRGGRQPPPTLIPVRDSKTPDDPCLTFEPTTWGSFVAALRDEGLGTPVPSRAAASS
ncbi:DUF397 domain-containing protein [Streptomyces tubbatahanensis]|uniref:DUF397 domain-containing protein n=1 Tax=Streptomyces tubbatahanensis TaxID=2923272 RepID=UPI003C702360